MLALPHNPHDDVVVKLRKPLAAMPGTPAASVTVEQVVLLGLVAGAVAHLGHLVGAVDNALGEQEARRELEVVAGRAHGDRDGRARDPDLERLLGHERVEAVVAIVTADPHQRSLHGDPCHRGQR